MTQTPPLICQYIVAKEVHNITMRHLIAILVLLSTIGGANACSCPDDSSGIVNGLAAIPGGQTCSDIGNFDADSFQCSQVQNICCGGNEDDTDDSATDDEIEEEEEEEVVTPAQQQPAVVIPAFAPCTVCSGGITVDGSVSAGGGNTCTDLMVDAQSVADGSEECNAMKSAESRCCPPPPENPCTVCSGGLTVDGSVSLGGGLTCGGMIIDAANTDEVSDACTQMKNVESICCPVTAENPCPVCATTGITVVDTADNYCTNVFTEALAIEEDTAACALLKDAESTCCPVIETPCSVCAGGITVDASQPVDSLPQGTICGDLAASALLVEDTSAQCTVLKGAEETCCPPIVPCTFCESGFTVDTATVTASGGVTCEAIQEEALSVDVDSVSCTAIKNAEATCCPPVVDPCTVCPTGVTADATTLSAGVSCANIVAEALLIETSTTACSLLKDSEAVCCPAVVDPCTVCANGITADNTVALSDGTSCAAAVENALLVESTTAACIVNKEAEATCCPPDVVNPCLVCPGGIKVDNTTTPSEGVSCEEVVAEAKLIETDSTVCPVMKAAEATCCPAVLNPCSVCASGITADGTTVVGNGKTCADVLVDAPLLEADTIACALMKDAELSCCPVPAVNPCDVCAGGITVEATTNIGLGKTCGDLLADALNVESVSDKCVNLKSLEGTCCPVVPTIAPSTPPITAPTVGNATVVTLMPVASSTIETTSAPSIGSSSIAAATTTPPTQAGVPTVPITSAPVKSLVVERVTSSPVANSTDEIEVVEPAQLQDYEDNCATWAAEGECIVNPTYMNSVCALSCSTVDVNSSTSLAGSVFVVLVGIISSFYIMIAV